MQTLHSNVSQPTGHVPISSRKYVILNGSRTKIENELMLLQKVF